MSSFFSICLNKREKTRLNEFSENLEKMLEQIR